METRMLEAISEMIDCGPSTELVALKVRVRCAKVMLDKIIEARVSKNVPLFHDETLEEMEEEVKLNPKSKTAPTPKEQLMAEPMYFPIVDDDHKLDKIVVRIGEVKKDLEGDAKVVLDKITMTHNQAKGMKFSELSIP